MKDNMNNNMSDYTKDNMNKLEIGKLGSLPRTGNTPRVVQGITVRDELWSIRRFTYSVRVQGKNIMKLLALSALQAAKFKCSKWKTTQQRFMSALSVILHSFTESILISKIVNLKKEIFLLGY